MSDTKARARAFIDLFNAMRQERDDLRDDWHDDQKTLALVARQIGRALYGTDNDDPWLDDGLVGELTNVVDDYLDAREALGVTGPESRIGPAAWAKRRALESCIAAHKTRNAEGEPLRGFAEWCACGAPTTETEDNDEVLLTIIPRCAREALDAATPTASECTCAGEQETCKTCKGERVVCSVCGEPFEGKTPTYCFSKPCHAVPCPDCGGTGKTAQPAGPISDEYSQAAETAAVKGWWPVQCVQRAFVEGAQWWLFKERRETMFGSERDDAAAEAVRRYGEPSAEQPAMHDGARGIAPGADAWHDKAARYRRAAGALAEIGALLRTEAREADAEVDRLRAEVKRLKESPDEWAGWKAMCKQADGGGA